MTSTLYCEIACCESNGLSYNLACVGVLVSIRWSSDVVPHLARSHDEDKALKNNKKDEIHHYIIFMPSL